VNGEIGNKEEWKRVKQGEKNRDVIVVWDLDWLVQWHK
jgi:hypothetical protein